MALCTLCPKTTEPCCSGSLPVITLKSVVFPAPLGAITANFSPVLHKRNLLENFFGSNAWATFVAVSTTLPGCVLSGKWNETSRGSGEFRLSQFFSIDFSILCAIAALLAAYAAKTLDCRDFTLQFTLLQRVRCTQLLQCLFFLSFIRSNRYRYTFFPYLVPKPKILLQSSSKK